MGGAKLPYQAKRVIVYDCISNPPEKKNKKLKNKKIKNLTPEKKTQSKPHNSGTYKKGLPGCHDQIRQRTGPDNNEAFREKLYRTAWNPPPFFDKENIG